MKKIYEAIGKEKRWIIETDNDIKAFNRWRYQRHLMGATDLIMVGRTNRFPIDSKVDTHWTLNGLITDDEKDYSSLGDIIIIEPFEEQIDNPELANISEADTWFEDSIKLSDRATILMSTQKYNDLCNNPEFKKIIANMDVRLYEGEADLAVKMLFSDKDYIYIDVTEEGYILDNNERIDEIEYIKELIIRQGQITEEMQRSGRQVTYGGKSNFYNNTGEKANKVELDLEFLKGQAENVEIDEKNIQELNYRMISGLTSVVEGDTELGDELYASTDIGKIRKNQEDAVLLIKDEIIPDFKMMVVSDGMGGWLRGEVASNAVITKLKEWFENLTEEERICYYTGVSGLEESLKDKICIDTQIEVEWKTDRMGGATVVCAIVGKKDTLIANIGDSRAYIIKDGKLKQVSREDTVAQENFENGKTPTKEAARFDEESNIITQALGMRREELKFPHIEVIKNEDYDMLLLFSDGVTDCLSDDDIAVVCKNSNREEVAKKLVEKAIRHDSIKQEELTYYDDLDLYIPGGKDNTTAAVYTPQKIKRREERVKTIQKDDDVER